MSKIILPGIDFCRVIRTSQGQQILLCIERDETNNPQVVGSASFIIKGCLTIVRQAFANIEIGKLLSFPSDPEIEKECADCILEDLTSLITEMLDTQPNTQEFIHIHTHSSSALH